MRRMVAILIACSPAAWCDPQYTVMYQSFRLYGEVIEALRPATDGAHVVGYVDDVPVTLLPQLALTTQPDGSLAWQGLAVNDNRVEAIAEAKLFADTGKRYQIVSEGEAIEFLKRENDGDYVLDHADTLPSSRIDLTLHPGSEDKAVLIKATGATTAFAGRDIALGTTLPVGPPSMAKSTWIETSEVPLGKWMFVLVKEPEGVAMGRFQQPPAQAETLFKVVIKNTQGLTSGGFGGGGFGGGSGGGSGGGLFGGGAFGGGEGSGGGFAGSFRSAADPNQAYAIHLFRVLSNTRIGTPRQVSIELKYMEVPNGTAEISLKQLTPCDDVEVKEGPVAAYRARMAPSDREQYVSAFIEALDKNKETELISAPRVTTQLNDGTYAGGVKLIRSGEDTDSGVLDEIVRMHPSLPEFMRKQHAAIIADITTAKPGDDPTAIPVGLAVALWARPGSNEDQYRVEMLSQWRRETGRDNILASQSFHVEYMYQTGDMYVFAQQLTENTTYLCLVTIEEISGSPKVFKANGQEHISADITGDGIPEDVPVHPRADSEPVQ